MKLKVTGLTCSLLYAVTFYCVPHYLCLLLFIGLDYNLDVADKIWLPWMMVIVFFYLCSH